jgi:NADH dehydrogenase
VLYNTYWIRYNHRNFTRAQAVENSLILFDAARQAGVERIVHVSIANPSEDSPFEYYRGKARLERAIQESGLSYAILRPTVLFGGGDILVNNIAWVLRRFPIFGLFGDGRYGIRPIHVDDFAALAVRQSAQTENTTIDAVGPERFVFRELVERIRAILGIRRMIVPMPALIGYVIGRITGLFVGDVILTRDEIGALMANLLDSAAEPAGDIRLTEWAAQHATTLGVKYASELSRRRP